MPSCLWWLPLHCRKMCYIWLKTLCAQSTPSDHLKHTASKNNSCRLKTVINGRQSPRPQCLEAVTYPARRGNEGYISAYMPHEDSGAVRSGLTVAAASPSHPRAIRNLPVKANAVAPQIKWSEQGETSVGKLACQVPQPWISLL
jgi:hypothetical protein